MTQLTPPNPLLQKVAILIRDLMQYNNEDLIKIGRQNMPQNDFKTSYIVVDQLGDRIRESSSEKFDGVNEVMTYGAVYKTEIAVEFYGDDAYSNANRLIGLLRSQASFERKQSLGIGTYQPRALTDLKQLTGQQYGNRLQTSFIVQDNGAVDVNTLRIDTAQYRFLSETEDIST